MRKIILVLLFISAGVLLFDFFIVLGAATDRGEDPDNSNKGKYEKTSSTAEGENENKGKCENLSKKDKSKIEKKPSENEKSYSEKYAEKIKAKTKVTAEREVTREFVTYPRKEKGEVDIDLVIGDYVIEAGLDKRTSLDSIQQALFFSVVTNKKPAVVIYDTDGKEGVCEYRIRKAIEKINEETEKVGKVRIIEYCWVKVTNKSRMSGINRLRKYGWEDDCPWERKPKKKKK